MAVYAVGVDLGGTNIKAGVCDAEGRVRSKLSITTEGQRGPEGVLDRIAEAARSAAERAGFRLSEVQAVGVGAPGTMDFEAGVVTIAPNLPGWRDVRLREGVFRRLGVTTVIENDANAAAFGEYWAGAGRSASLGTQAEGGTLLAGSASAAGASRQEGTESHADPMVLFTLGTGVGGGIVIGGEVLHGASGSAAELGHLIIHFGGRQCGCGNRGCLEAYASATAMVARFREAVQAGAGSSLAEKVRSGGEITAEGIHTAAVAGDRLSGEILTETGVLLGYGVVSIVHAVNPQRVVLSGGMIGAGEMLMEPVRRTVKEMAFPQAQKRLEVVFAHLGGDAGFIGAAGCALRSSATSA
jgi:glucokinase